MAYVAELKWTGSTLSGDVWLVMSPQNRFKTEFVVETDAAKVRKHTV